MKKVYFSLLFVLFFSITRVYAEDITYTNEKYNFSIMHPSNYRTFRNFRGVAIAIFFPSAGFFNFFNGYVNVAVKSTKPAYRPIEELVDIYFKYDKTVLEREQVKINNIDFFSVVQAKRMFFLDLKLYSLITVKGTKVYMISYVNTAKNYEKYINKANEIMHSFRFVEK